MILVVDDLPRNLRLLDAVLSPRGYDGSSPPPARKPWRSAEPRVDLVLLDIVMPGMTGTRCAVASGAAHRRFLPVVMITASGDQEKVRAIEAGPTTS